MIYIEYRSSQFSRAWFALDETCAPSSFISMSNSIVPSRYTPVDRTLVHTRTDEGHIVNLEVPNEVACPVGRDRCNAPGTPPLDKELTCLQATVAPSGFTCAEDILHLDVPDQFSPADELALAVDYEDKFAQILLPIVRDAPARRETTLGSHTVIVPMVAEAPDGTARIYLWVIRGDTALNASLARASIAAGCQLATDPGLVRWPVRCRFSLWFAHAVLFFSLNFVY